MSNLEPGTYALRSVTIGKRMGLGGMYATREEPGAPIHITAKIPSAIDRQNWDIRPAEGNAYYIVSPHTPSREELIGFHNESIENHGPATLGSPKSFIIKSVGNVPFGDDVYM
ncbi:hypothetical protein CTheo_1862 [Ceratobasidium theobromae]|uniref:Uncharacterized protein n=1 Tax=Ceratobasidium theobromae TaxID=1582974 RepID=A0A5N5QSJ2_9AGAM|nr:hypothetical protein CTheo_1862 [Ceratobasidium theobromae]